jgi:hypothetical protein
MDPALKAQITKWYTLPADVPIVSLDAQDLFDADVWMIADSHVYYIQGKDFPVTWKKDEWADFVVKLIKGQNTAHVGVIYELAESELPQVQAWWGWIYISSFSEMLSLAGSPGPAPPGEPTLIIRTENATTKESLPYVALSLNGDLIGQTGLSGLLSTTLPLPPGTYTIRAEREGFEPATKTVTISGS